MKTRQVLFIAAIALCLLSACGAPDPTAEERAAQTAEAALHEEGYANATAGVEALATAKAYGDQAAGFRRDATVQALSGKHDFADRSIRAAEQADGLKNTMLEAAGAYASRAATLMPVPTPTPLPEGRPTVIVTPTSEDTIAPTP